MTVTSSFLDEGALTLTFVNELEASPERVWELWENPRLLERWWGPVEWPATFSRHDFVVGGASSYFMTGPEGEKAHGWWRTTAIEAPARIELDDGFSDEAGEPDTSMGAMHLEVALEPVDGGTRMTIVTHFESKEQEEQMAAMGMEEGMRSALSQIDAMLAEDA